MRKSRAPAAGQLSFDDLEEMAQRESRLDERLWWTTVRPVSSRRQITALRRYAESMSRVSPEVARFPVALSGIQPPTSEYSEIIPARRGFWVYRLWAADGTCLYVGMVGKRGPRRVQERFKEHEQDYPRRWSRVAHREARAFAASEETASEETRQIAALMPIWNKQGTGAYWSRAT